MLELSQSFINRPVMSLRTGGQAAIAKKPIINPDDLKIEGFYCQDQSSKNLLILLDQDIRDFIPQGIVINDHEVLTPESDLVRHKKIIDLKFELLGKPVITEEKKRVGKVVDYAAETQSMYIRRLYVSQSLFKNFSNDQLSVDRSQIIEITNRKVVINDPLQMTTATAPA